jgi:eukaryotic-like serine/threonine-protein kinase
MAARQHAVPLPPGTPLGSMMTVERVLGQGGTAVVYAARHVYFSSPVAVKVVSLRSHSSGARERLLREAELCTKLRDQRLPKVYYADQLPDGSPYIVMEKVDGVTLRGALARGPLPLHVAAAIADQLLELLSIIHGASIVHRDVKPGNIIIERRPSGVRLRLIDFGFGLGIDEGVQPAPDSSRVMGTPSYMAPEQVAGLAVDARADLYAAGVVLYEMLSGRVPQRAASMVQRRSEPDGPRGAPLAEIAPTLPASVVAVVERAIEAAPDARFQNADAMREALQQALG